MKQKERNNDNHPILVIEMALGMNLVAGTFPSLSASNFACMVSAHPTRTFDSNPFVCRQPFKDESIFSFGFIKETGGSVGDKKSARDERAKETSEGMKMGGEKDVSLSVSLSLDNPRSISGGRHATSPHISSFSFLFDLKSTPNPTCVIPPLRHRTILSPVISSLTSTSLYVDLRDGRCLGKVYGSAIFDLFGIEGDDC